MMNTFVNKEIEINSFTFINKEGLRPVPRCITVDNRQYSFEDSGLQFLIKKGQRFIRLFDLTDGRRVFRLRQEDNQWMLVSVKALS